MRAATVLGTLSAPKRKKDEEVWLHLDKLQAQHLLGLIRHRLIAIFCFVVLVSSNSVLSGDSCNQAEVQHVEVYQF